MYGFIKLTGYSGPELIAVDQISSVSTIDRYRPSEGSYVQIIGKSSPRRYRHTVEEIEGFIEAAMITYQDDSLSHVSR